MRPNKVEPIRHSFIDLTIMTDSQRIILLRDQTLFIFQELIKSLQRHQDETDQVNSSLEKTLSTIRERERQLENAELSLAVTAPMKAGKSTILNAIIGDGILPSRALAMTVLPTKVQLCRGYEEPKLLLSRAFHNAIQELLDPDDFSEIDWGNDGTVLGAQQIRETLTLLNDKVRSALQEGKTFEIPYNGNDIPTVYAKLPIHLENAKNPRGSTPQGSLILIDTPGPNEANIGEALQLIVRGILQNASMVAVVLDYTQLTSEAAEHTKNEVSTISSTIGDDNVIYLVNKVDQRRTGDLTTKGVEDFISHSYENNAKLGKNLFEISASKGYAAGSFIRGVTTTEVLDDDLKKMPFAISLAQELYELWEEELEDATVLQFDRKAKRLWSNSGIEDFLSVCIEELTGRAYEKTVYTSIDFLSNQLQQIEDQVNLQISASSSSNRQIAQEIELLSSDINQVENARNQSKLIQETRKNIQEKIYTSITEARRSAQLTIKDFFQDNRRRKGGGMRLHDSEEYKEKSKSGTISLPGPLELLPDFLNPREIFKNLKQVVDDQLEILSDILVNKGKRDGDVLEFTSRSDADEAMRQIKLTLDKRVDAYVRAAKMQVENEVGKAQKGIRDFTQKTTIKVLRNAQARLNEAFSAELSLPPPELNFSYEPGGVNVEPGEVKRVKAGKVVTVTKEDDRWFTLWGVFGLFKRNVQVKLPDEEIDVFVIDMSEVVLDVNSSIARGFESMQRVVEQYIVDDLEQSLGDYYVEVNSFLSRYQKTLQVAQDQASKSAEEQCILLNSSRNLQASIRTNQCKLEKVKSGEALELASLLPHSTYAEDIDDESLSDSPRELVRLLDDKGEIQAGAFLYNSEESCQILDKINGEKIVGSQSCGSQIISKLIGDSAASLAPAFATAVQSGQVMRIIGPPSVVEGLANGSMALMQSGSNSLGTIVSSGSKNIVGQARFAPAGGIIAPLLVYQAVHAIAGTQQLNQINRRLAGIERTLSQILERQNAKDLGEVYAACTTLNDILAEHSHTGHFSPQMQDRLSHCERDLRSHYERLRFLGNAFHEKVSKAKAGLRRHDTTIELAILIKEYGDQFAQDVRLLFSLATAVIQVEHGLLLVAIEHNPNSLGYRCEQVNNRIGELRNVLSGMVDVVEIKREIQGCLKEMNWWDRNVFKRSQVDLLMDALDVHAIEYNSEASPCSDASNGEGFLVWQDPERGVQTRALIEGVNFREQP